MDVAIFACSLSFSQAARRSWLVVVFCFGVVCRRLVGVYSCGFRYTYVSICFCRPANKYGGCGAKRRPVSILFLLIFRGTVIIINSTRLIPSAFFAVVVFGSIIFELTAVRQCRRSVRKMPFGGPRLSFVRPFKRTALLRSFSLLFRISLALSVQRTREHFRGYNSAIYISDGRILEMLAYLGTHLVIRAKNGQQLLHLLNIAKASIV